MGSARIARSTGDNATFRESVEGVDGKESEGRICGTGMIAACSLETASPVVARR